MVSKNKNLSFLAIDFETANYYRNSACAVGLVKVKNYEIIKKKFFLIKPPQREFYFTYIHGITWKDVMNEPMFDELWPRIRPFFTDFDFVAAHNASFDRSVLRKCCEYYDIEYSYIYFLCTVQLSRKLWNIYPTNLPTVCNYFKIPLKHHDALSDTEACAQIMLRILREKKFLYELTQN